MTTAVVFVQRCMVILAFLLCYFQVQSLNVDCALYPYHHTCRGTMARKRAMIPIVYGTGCEDSKGNINCIQEFEERHRIPYIPIPKSKLLIALLDNDLQKDITRSARRKLRSEELDERKPTLMEKFLSELESSDSY